MDSTQSPANFWSRRRAAVEAETAAELATYEAAKAAETQRAVEAARAEKTDAEILEELGLKNPDDMIAGDDFAAFMRSAVPERLRRRALRVLWRSNPVLANLDGLLDHDDDFTDAATVMPDMKTTYQVGKGMLHHVQEMARQAEKLGNPPDAVDEDESPEIVDESCAPESEMVLATHNVEAESNDAPIVGQAELDLVEPPRRHMRFAFTEDSRREN